MTYEHIKAACSGVGSAFAELRAVIDIIVSGALPHVPELLDCRLIAVQKPGGRGIRPIAIGEALYRLAGLCAMRACPNAGCDLAPLQLGVGVSGGSPAVGHAVRAYLAANPDCVLVQVDAVNAFNSVDRSPLLAAVHRRYPGLFAFACYAYRSASRLFVDGAPAGTPPVLSERGVRQGDPCGGLFFAATVQGGLEQLCRAHPSVLPAAYLDDSSLLGTPEAVIAAFPAFCDLSADVGLAVSRPKSGVYSPTAQAAAHTAAALGLAHHTDGVVVVGTPIGTDAFVTAHVSARADALRASVDLLLGTPVSVQDKLLLLRCSLQHRPAHLLRVVPWHLQRDAIGRAERLVAAAVFRLAGHPPPLDAAGALLGDGASWRQVTLPLRHGGLDIRATTEREANAGYLAAAALTERIMRSGPRQLRPLSGPHGGAFTALWHDLHTAGTAEEAFWSVTGAEKAPWTPEQRDLTPDVIDKVLPAAPRTFGRLLAAWHCAEQLASFDLGTASGRKAAARWRSSAGMPASGWVTAMPVHHSLVLSDAATVTALRLRLGLPFLPGNTNGMLCSCHGRLLANDSDHALACTSLRGSTISRHDHIVAALRNCIRRAGIASSREPRVDDLPGAAATGRAARPRSRLDVLLTLASAGITGVDVSVAHPSAESYVDRAAVETGSAAAQRDREKRLSYESADPHGYKFYPFSVESYGRLGHPAMELINELGEEAVGAAPPGDVVKGDFVRAAYQELSVALCRGNAWVVRDCTMTLAQRSGVNFQPGLGCPSADVGAG
jgi:hypothetical protein